MMLTETLLSFDEWQNTLITEGANLPQDASLQHKLYEKYCADYHGNTGVQTLNG